MDTRYSSVTALDKATKFSPSIYRAYLAEDYDGISQYVLTKLTHGGVSSGLKVRVAAGDHSGHTPMPEGTAVVVSSINGTLEVLLGQKGRRLGFIQAAYNAQEVGLPYSGIPRLPHEVSPGHLLFALMFAAGNTTRFPTQFRFLDDPPMPPASPPTPVYPNTGGWTVLATSLTDYSGNGFGGACNDWLGPFNGSFGGFACSQGILVGAAYRMVGDNEDTKYPVAVSTEITDSQVGMYLWEIDTDEEPSGVAVSADGHITNPSYSTGADVPIELPSIEGNAAAIVMYACAVGHVAVTNPANNVITGDGAEIFQGCAIPGSHAPTRDNDPDYITPHVNNFGELISLPAGGVASSDLTMRSGERGANWCGVAVELPEGVDLPWPIYPDNVIDLGEST